MSPAAFVEAASAWALAPGFTPAQATRSISAAADAAHVEAASAWALAPGFTPARGGRSISAAADAAHVEDDRRCRSTDLRTRDDNAMGTGGAVARGAYPSDHGHRQVTVESEAA